MDDLPKLTVKQRRFVDAYLGIANGNASEAATIAGYKDPPNAGWALRKNQDVNAHIEARLGAEALSANEVLHRLRDLATAEWRHFLEIVTDPRTGELVRVRMDLSAQTKALELLGKHHRLFIDKVEQTNTTFIREYGDGDH